MQIEKVAIVTFKKTQLPFFPKIPKSRKVGVSISYIPQIVIHIFIEFV
jgi:hypothetical protein